MDLERRTHGKDEKRIHFSQKSKEIAFEFVDWTYLA
jgi:hypothetical protein